jgi:hypothetical protein
MDIARLMLLALLPTFNAGIDPARPLAANQSKSESGRRPLVIYQST